MKANSDFLKAKTDKSLTDILIQRVNGRDRFALILKYTQVHGSLQVETETEIITETFHEQREISRISFLIGIFNPHIRTFLNSIRKDSDVSFKVRTGNTNQYHKEAGLQSYELFGRINDRWYLLDTSIQPENSASPVQF